MDETKKDERMQKKVKITIVNEEKVIFILLIIKYVVYSKIANILVNSSTLPCPLVNLRIHFNIQQLKFAL